MTMRRILVAGATGKQGGALIAELLARPSQPYEIYALTRSKTSNSAQALSKKPNVRIVEGDFNNAAAIFEQVPKPLWGMFLLTNPMVGAQKEEAQGKEIVKAAVQAGVSYIVSSATDNGGQKPCMVPHFESKAQIENEILDQAANSNNKLIWTFLRPVAFYENLMPGFVGKLWISSWRLVLGEDRKLQMMSGRDVGKVAARAFLEYDNRDFHNRAISLAGDEINLSEAASIFKQQTGQTLPSTFGFIAWTLKSIFWDQFGVMLEFFKSPGFAADMSLMKKEFPELKDFRSWLREESAWKSS